MDEVQEMCRSFVWHFFQTEDYIGHFDVVHAHDWLASNAMVWIKQGRRDHRAVLTMHSTEYGRCGNNFWDGASARIRDHERHGTYCADRRHRRQRRAQGRVDVDVQPAGLEVLGDSQRRAGAQVRRLH